MAESINARFYQTLQGEALKALPPDLEGQVRQLWEEHLDLLKAAQVRRLIDLYLCRSRDPDHVAALMLTIITAGDLFGYNRAILLLKDRDTGYLCATAGIGPASHKEALSKWQNILDEKLDFGALVMRAYDNVQEEKRHLTPILERLRFDPASGDRLGVALSGADPDVLRRDRDGDEGAALFDPLMTDQVGVLPLWGHWGHFGTILVDNFVTERAMTTEDLGDLSLFIQPFASFLERAIIIDQYENKVRELTAAQEQIETQRELLLKMEKRALLNRYTAVLAHNVKNPVLSMTGHLRLLKDCPGLGEDGRGLIESLNRDVAALDAFAGDFISRVEEEHPSRHFWDLNHLVREALQIFREACPQEMVTLKLTESELPLVVLDYDLTRSLIIRILGHLVPDRTVPVQLAVSTSLAAGKVRVAVAVREQGPPLEGTGPLPSQWDKLSGRLAAEGITLSLDNGDIVLEFPMADLKGVVNAQNSGGR